MEGADRAEVLGSVWCGTASAKNVGTIHHQKSVGQNDFGRCRKSDAIGDGRWQLEPQHKEELELVRHSTDDLRFDGSLINQAYNAGRRGGHAIGKSSWEMTDSAHGQA